MRQSLSVEEVERAITTAYALIGEQSGLMPHMVIDDLIGLNNYRRFMRCPDAETLAAYVEDTLSFEEALQISTHENRCPVCQADIADLRSYARQQITQLFAAMPYWATPFVGREEIRESLGAALAEGEGQLITLAADAGTGKTRLTMETAVEQSYLFPDGVWYVSLSGLDDGTRAAAEIAHTVRLPLQRRQDPQEQLREYFADKRALLVLDNVSAHSPTARMVAELVDRTPGLCCMATSIHALGFSGEQVVPLPPLRTLPRERDLEKLLSSESVQLFTEHVLAFQADYRFSEADLFSTAALCERAKGLPLGIELAAACVREMSPEELLRHLTRRDASGHHAADSLSDLMAWSYEMLSKREQELLPQLSVFAEGFFAEQVAAICEAEDAALLLTNLEEKAMLQHVEALGRPRYQLLTPVRHFAARLLGERQTQIQRKHMTYFLQFAQEKNAQLTGHQQIQAMQEITTDLSNLRAGMDRAWEQDEAPIAGGYGLAMWQTLFQRGSWDEWASRLSLSVQAFEKASDSVNAEKARLGLAFCQAFLAQYEEASTIFREVADAASQRDDASTLAEARYGLAWIAQYQGRSSEAVAGFEEALKLLRKAGHRERAADALQNLGRVASQQGDYERAESLLIESLAMQRERGDRYRIGNTLGVLGNLALDQGRLQEARQWFEEALQLRHDFGDIRGIAAALGNLGRVWKALNDYPRAEYYLGEAVCRFERLNDHRALGQALSDQGDLAIEQGDLSRARDRFEASRKVLETVGDPYDVARALGGLGWVAEQEGKIEEAARLYRNSLARLYEQGHRVGIATLLSRCGRLLRIQGDRERAALVMTATLRLFEEPFPERAETESDLRGGEGIDKSRMAIIRSRAEALTLDELIALACTEREDV